MPTSKMAAFHTNRTKDILHVLQIKLYYVAEFVCPHLLYWPFTESKSASLKICDEMGEMFERNFWSVMVKSLLPSGSWWNFSCNVMYNTATAYVLAGTAVRFDATPRQVDPFCLSLGTGISLIHILEGNLRWKSFLLPRAFRRITLTLWPWSWTFTV